MPTSEVAPTLVSRITPRSSPKKWKSHKSYLGPTNRHKKSAQSPSACVLRRSNGNKAAGTPEASPKSLIQRLSVSPLAEKGGPVVIPQSEPPESPTKLLERLMKSEALSAIFSTGNEVPMDMSGDQERHINSSSLAADNMVEDDPSTTVAADTGIKDTEQEPLQPASPIPSTSAAGVDEILQIGSGSDAANPDTPAPNSASFVNGHPSAISSTPAQASAPLYEECKRLVVQLAMQNAQARNPKSDIAAKSEKMEQQIATLVTDEHCVDFIAKAKQIEEQMAAKKDSIVEGTGLTQNGDSVVGVKRTRDEVDDGLVSSVPSSSPTNKPAPRAPKAMVMKNAVWNKFTSMVPSSSYNTSASTLPARSDTNGRSNFQHEIPIPSSPKYTRHLTSSDQADPRGERKRQRRDHDEKPRDVDHRRRDSRHSDFGSDKSDRERRASDIRSREIDHSSGDSRSAESHSERSERRRRDREDMERDHDRDRKDFHSNSKEHHITESSRHKSHELITTPMSVPKISAPLDTRSHRSSPVIPGCPVPGLWFFKVGSEGPDILEAEFEIVPELKLYSREDSCGVVFHLLCLPTYLVKDTLGKLDPAASPEDVTNAMWNISTQWPSDGKLIIEVNPGDSMGRSWLPLDLNPVERPLNLTAHVRQGRNNIRFIHLGDLSSRIFMLHVAESRPSDTKHLAQTLDSKYVPTPDLVDSDWDTYTRRLKAKTEKDLDILPGSLEFAGRLTHVGPF